MDTRLLVWADFFVCSKSNFFISVKCCVIFESAHYLLLASDLIFLDFGFHIPKMKWPK